MKTNKFFGLAAIIGGFALSMTSCSQEDNPAPVKKTVTISFENATLGADGVWNGDESGVKTESWGVDLYACSYVEGDATFPVNWMPAYQTWSGFAVSNRTATTFDKLFPDQFNSIAGKAYKGNNYCVIYTFGEVISFKEPSDVKGFYFTNSAYTAKAITEGDGMTPGAFDATDWLKCIVTGELADGTQKTVEIMLAEKDRYVKDWEYADLSSLGKVVSLSFSFDGTRKNDWGLTTPTYICIDDIIIEK